VGEAVGVGVPVLPAMEESTGTSLPRRKPVEPATTGPALVLVSVEQLAT